MYKYSLVNALTHYLQIFFFLLLFKNERGMHSGLVEKRVLVSSYYDRLHNWLFKFVLMFQFLKRLCVQSIS